MSEIDCEPKKYEATKARLILGDKARAKKFCEELNGIVKKRDGFLRQGINRSNISDAIHAAFDCLERHGLQSIPVQKRLDEVE
ncbi:MAG: hypothetical protein PHV30_09150 [Candidatus Margulisbacteria bacterium]|nr:hypothetical protein [Candidatus Margulisiibacteriota bacterium]